MNKGINFIFALVWC